MRLIDADDLIKSIDYSAGLGGALGKVVEVVKNYAKYMVETAPTIKEQKTGHWIITEVRQYDLAYGVRIYVPEYVCSCCGHWYESYIRGDEPKMPEDADFPKYCEQCGARMECEEE